MAIFCKFPTVNLSNSNFVLVICIAKSHFDNFKGNFLNIRIFFALSDYRFSSSYISAKYFPILTSHNEKLIYSAFRLCINLSFQKDCINLSFQKLTFMTGFVAQGHILIHGHILDFIH